MADEQLVNMIVGRLDHLDKKMDTLGTALATQARIEERIANQSAAMKYMEDDIENQNIRIKKLERGYWKFVGIITTLSLIAGAVAPELAKKLLQ